jgi:2-oxoglutarate dehydrogenase E2 component (dihydrolipoamide succinyltransferase)
LLTAKGIALSELENLAGTGNEGRVTKKDILQYVADKKAGKAGSKKEEAVGSRQSAVSSEPAAPRVEYPSGNVEIIEMDRMRKLIAKTHG